MNSQQKPRVFGQPTYRTFIFQMVSKATGQRNCITCWAQHALQARAAVLAAYQDSQQDFKLTAITEGRFVTGIHCDRGSLL